MTSFAVDVPYKNDTIVPSIGELDDYLTEHNSNVGWLLAATILSCGWIIYLTYYNSRNMGFVLTILLNRFYKYGHIHFGSFTFSVLSGKVMFRDVHFVNEDMSIRIQDGLLIFRWWRIYNPKQKHNDPRAETRLHGTLNGFELHVYNRSSLYAHVEEVFGLEPTVILPPKDKPPCKAAPKSDSTQAKKPETEDPASSWRSLIPVIKLDIHSVSR